MIILITATALLVGGFLMLKKDNNFEVDGTAQITENPAFVSAITGEPCSYVKQRPVAVMFSSDPVTRPLIGIGQADIVFEMPVTPGGITRMMGVFQCNQPELIGSIRSARQDFIPLAGGLGAIYAHWGGEHDALAMLNGGIIDNIDAMKYEGTTFYRRGKLKPPHNGFSDMGKLLERAEALNYGLENSFEGYRHGDISHTRSMSNISTSVTVPFEEPYDVVWRYDAITGQYLRFRNGKPEVDEGLGTQSNQVSSRVVVVLETTATSINEFYNRVVTTGEGRATIHQNGVQVGATWKKGHSIDSKLVFLDSDGKEVVFTPGKIWVEIVTN